MDTQNSGIKVRGAAALAVQFAVLALAGIGEAHAANRAPSISGSPGGVVMVGERYVFKPSAYDANGDKLRFTVENKPRWASFDAATGKLAGTPESGAAGSYDGIRIRVSDGKASDVLGPFSILVRKANRAPRISGAPATVATVAQAGRLTMRQVRRSPQASTSASASASATARRRPRSPRSRSRSRSRTARPSSPVRRRARRRSARPGSSRRRRGTPTAMR